MESFDLANSPELELEQMKMRLVELLEDATSTQLIIEHWQHQKQKIKDEALTLLVKIGEKFEGEKNDRQKVVNLAVHLLTYP